MTIRATNPTNLTGPTSPSLLDQSKATPSDINPELFKSRSPSRQPTEGAVSSDYLKRTREEDPWPPESSCAPKTNAPAKTATVTLSDCRIDTPPEDLATDQPFQMSCQATTSDGSPLKGDIRFKLYCTLPDGTEKPINLSAIGQRKGDRYCAEGTLFSPKEPVEWGAPLKYYVTAEHPGAGEKAKSGVAEVVGYMPPKPVAAWELLDECFEETTSFVLPKAQMTFRDIQSSTINLDDWRFIIIGFGHSELARRRALSVYCFLSHDCEIYENSILSPEGDCNWHEYVALQMIHHLERECLHIDHIDDLCSIYINSISPVFIPADSYVFSSSAHGPSCCICIRGASFRQSSADSLSKNDQTPRASVFIVAFEQARSPAYIPCSQWYSENLRCKVQGDSGNDIRECSHESLSIGCAFFNLISQLSKSQR